MDAVRMTTTTPDQITGGGPVPRVSRALGRVADVLELYSAAAVRIARVLVVGAVLMIMVMVAGNVFTRNVLGFSIFSSEELARFAYLWAIWMGVSLAVRRSAVTVIGFVAERGPEWWRHAVKAFAGLALAALLAYTCWRATEYATSRIAVDGFSSTAGVSWFYPIVSMAIGYYFITLHYLRDGVAAAARVAAAGRAGWVTALRGLAGGLLIGAALWLVCDLLLNRTGVSPLVVLGLIFVVLTLAGMPVVFMLSLVGILAFLPGFFGLSFYPSPDPLVPFSTTQSNMGLTGGGELLVIVMFLVVAEVLNASGMSTRLIAFASACVGHLRGGMAYVCQLTSALASGISGSAQADAAIMTPLLVPAMEREGYRRDVAAAVVAGASIKGPIGPISVMFIVYGSIVGGAASASINKLLLSGVFAELLLLLFQAATVYVVARRLDFLPRRRFAGVREVGRTGLVSAPVLLIPVIILGGILKGYFTPTESAAVAAVVAIGMALFLYGTVSPLQLPDALVLAGLEAGIVMLLIGDSTIVAKALYYAGFGQSLEDFMRDITSDKYVFLLVVNILLLLVGVFIEPLPALYILAPFLAVVAVETYGIDPVHFGLIMVFNLVLALIHPPIGLVLFLVSSLAKVSIERLSIMIIPWLAVSLVVLFLVTYLPGDIVLALSNLVH
jgi:tripartite ATP-independent transporter DctM subunit